MFLELNRVKDELGFLKYKSQYVGNNGVDQVGSNNNGGTFAHN